MYIVDRRLNPNSKSLENRQRFLRRAKAQLKDAVRHASRGRGIREGVDGGVYHSAYDTYEHYVRFGDPGFKYGAALAQTVGRMVLRLSQADAPPMRFSDTAATVAEYVDELKKLNTSQRDRAETLDRLLDARAFTLASDPQRVLDAPTREPAMATSPRGTATAMEGGT